MEICWRKVLFLGCFVCMSQLQAAVNVNCDTSPPGALSAALASASAGTTINVSGVCHDSLYIDKDDISLVGNVGSTTATITGFFPQHRVTIDGARRVHLEGIIISNGIFGISAIANASFSLTDVEVRDNIIGADIDNGSNATADGTVVISGSRVFGLNVINGAKFGLNENAKLELTTNVLGAQIAINSSFFAARGAEVIANDNDTIGFSVNTGSTGFLFNASLRASNNGLDGVDVVSASSFEVDGESELVSENNGREGISIDNGALNLFGAFSTIKGLPRVTANGNALNGILVENTSKLDVGRNASIIALNNGGAGVSLDDGSSAVLQRSEISGNHGELPAMSGEDDEHVDKAADVVASFASRVSFKQNPDNSGDITSNIVGLAICDHSSIARGDVPCKRRRD